LSSCHQLSLSINCKADDILPMFEVDFLLSCFDIHFDCHAGSGKEYTLTSF
jgi:hypothetical protein